MSTSTRSVGRPGALRTRLVGAALGLLAEDGAHAVSLRAVARRAGVSAMAPYRHYPDKEALLAAVAVQGFDGLRAALRTADDTAAPGQALVAQAAAYVGYAVQNPALFRLMFGHKRLGAHPELTAAGETAYAVLAERVATELPADADREALTLGCWSLVHGLASLFLDGQMGEEMAAAHGDVARRVAEVMMDPRRPLGPR